MNNNWSPHGLYTKYFQEVFKLVYVPYISRTDIFTILDWIGEFTRAWFRDCVMFSLL